jgi:hypothetical protein
MTESSPPEAPKGAYRFPYASQPSGFSIPRALVTVRHPEADIEITLDMLLSTGAPITELPRAAIELLDLPVKARQIRGANPLMYAATLRLAGRDLPRMLVLQSPDDAAILGWDVLCHFYVSFDGLSQYTVIEPPSDGPAR